MRGKEAIKLFRNGKPPIVTPHKYEGLGKKQMDVQKTFTTTLQNGGLKRYEVLQGM